MAPADAAAFCGFYVNGAGGDMFNDATQVVLMRAGTRTVLSMQNAYKGPVADFALVIPVPVVLQEQNVKTLPKEVFAKVDAMGAPRLVEYWEIDPCYVPQRYYADEAVMAVPSSAPVDLAEAEDRGVTIEAQFAVGEYQIVILSARDSTGLDGWLRDQKYKIPAGAEPLLRPYVEGGSKFFVAKVDPKKVAFDKGQAVLSPLRFHYDSEELSLPIRLGLASSAGTQDLIVNILAPGQRYELANYKNATIPTNLDVKDEVRKRFGEFYAALFDKTLEKNPGAVITEYAWDASTCDPCPGPTLDEADFATLGADVTGVESYGLVLTRLHARYGKRDVPNDLVFRAAPPIAGGRETYVGGDDEGVGGKLEERASPSPYNNFQGRYIIRHPWTGPIQCASPIRGRWGGPPAELEMAMASGPVAATNVAQAPRGNLSLPQMVARDVPEIGVVAAAPSALPTRGQRGARGCSCEVGADGAAGAAGGAALLAVLALVGRRRRGGRRQGR
jgi:MYXO-CTERM domain-containing protein